MSAYYLSGSDLRRATLYNALAYKMCEALDVPESHTVGRMSLLIGAALASTHKERMQKLRYTRCFVVFAP